MRLFIALLFNQNKLNAIDSKKKQLIDLGINGHYVPKDLLHLTLYYIGETKESDLDKFKIALSQIHHAKFSINTGQIDAFKKHKNKKIIYLSIEKNQPLMTCYKKVISQLQSVAPNVHSDGLTPHITLIRKAEIDINKLDSIHVDPMTIAIDSIHMMASKRIKQRLVYESIDHVQLK